MKRLFNAPGSQAGFSFFLPNGQYGDLVICISGTAAAGVTLTRLNFGILQLQWNGKDVISPIDLDFLNRVDNIYGGVSAFTSAIGGAFYGFIVIPCSAWFDSLNVYDVQNGDNVSIVLNFPDLANAAITANAQVTVYGNLKVGVMNYLHKITTRNVPMGGLGSQTDTFPIANVMQVYLKDPVARLVTQYQLQKDGKEVTNGNIADLIAYSDWIHTLETTNTILAIELAPSKAIEEAAGLNLTYTVTVSGATTVLQYFSYVQWTPEKAMSSRLVSQQVLQNKISGV